MDITNEQAKPVANERLTQFKSVIRHMIATSSDAYQRLSGKSSTNSTQRAYTSEEIRQIVDYGNPTQRAALSQYFFMTNGLYKRIIVHYATFLTYSWIIVPQKKKETYKMSIKKINQSYFEATEFCSNFQVQRKCALFAKDILVNGAYYGLLHDDGESIVIQDLPFDYCRSRFKNADDIDIVEFNMAFFDTIRDENLRKEILKTYPKIIEKGYNAYRRDPNQKWIYLPAEIGIYFSFFEERPFFLDLIPLLDNLDEYKDIDKQRNLLALKRILVQKVPIDGQDLVFEPQEAEEMHNGVVNMTANNPELDVITTYNDITLLDLSADDDEKTEIKDIQQLIYESAGLSKEFFCSTTEAGLKYSTLNDLAMMMILGQRFANFFTSMLNYKYENKYTTFKLIILPISYYNADEYQSRQKELAAFGYSFLIPILASGLDQTTLAPLKELENDVLELDEILKPLQSAYTQSGKQAGQPIGENDNKQEEKKEETQEKDKEKEKEEKETNETKQNTNKKEGKE